MPQDIEDDVFQDSGPEIVDCDTLEAHKENIQRLVSGRKVTALSSALATPHAHREAKLAATRHRLRMNIQVALEDEDDDPLEAYCRLVNWTVENYPEGHNAESGLLELLEEATRALKDDRDGRWRGEMKYLKLWLLYASFVNKPTTIYKFLLANEIGTDIALLYEEYAAVLERDGRRKAADEVYLLGMARRAQPLDHLKSRHHEFQKRMMCAAMAPPPEAPVPAANSSRRTALATSSSSKSTAPLASSPANAPSTSRTNATIRPFVDPAGAAEPSTSTNPWPELGGRKERVKENVPAKKKLAESTLRQSSRTKRPAAGPSIVPFRDPEPGAMSPPIVPYVDAVGEVPQTPKITPYRDESINTSPRSGPAPGSVMKPKPTSARTATHSEAEALRKDPLKNYGEEGVGFAEDEVE
ncbi:Mad3/BUB1 homology region 1-domain-containing protein [Schizophyllum amplum]|uniref:Mad3/BUB1 homology region 1-domain-containing protein n=1 Tax=Schizophyllum amplum TaxID=97359 RepID=A0A550CBN7_9AGAR|nr:Mad3/BUB1 homology region 1-domain-containing protein [Auriculariopsis ampla]